MTDVQDRGGGPEADFEAAELALGVLDVDVTADAERRADRDPAFASEVETWRDLLAPLSLEAAAQTPPGSVWATILARIGATNAVELRLRRRLTLWQGATAALAASLALVLFLPHGGPSPPPRPNAASAGSVMMTARLTSSTGPVAFIAVFDPQRRELVLAPAAITARRGRSPQLWLLPQGGKPISLGVAAFGQAIRLSPAAAVGGAGRSALAISIEPLGGSPTGQPTGPVVATGQLERL